MGRALAAFTPALPGRIPTQVRSRHATVVCRTRRGRARRVELPPVVPPDAAARQRAIELLGHATQRRASARVSKELAGLIGRAPDTREDAAAWKAALSKRARVAPLCGKPCAVRDAARLPDGARADARLGRAFSALDMARRTLSHGRTLPVANAEELRRDVGVAPMSEWETERLVGALSVLALKRKREERRPRRMPRELEELSTVVMLLGVYGNRGGVGAKTEWLREALGGVPRTKGVARSWKKLAEAKMRRIGRRIRARERREERAVIKERRKEDKKERIIFVSEMGKCVRWWTTAVVKAVRERM